MANQTQLTIKPLSAEETRQAQASYIALMQFLEQNKQFLRHASLHIQGERVSVENSEILLPNSTLSLLSKILHEMGNGKNVQILATDAEMTTQEAANFLNVSRPYLVKLLEQRRIPFRLVGSRRRVLLADILHYRELEEADRNRGLDELVSEAQKLGMY